MTPQQGQYIPSYFKNTQHLLHLLYFSFRGPRTVFFGSYSGFTHTPLHIIGLID
uniref:Uncharacterized protein n=1 Tax=uncultured marine virus TaxID=186617 RepID=A0A0F7L6S8_9VIRU|nr:hypothetical protein [uncultured marine virus]